MIRARRVLFALFLTFWTQPAFAWCPVPWPPPPCLQALRADLIATGVVLSEREIPDPAGFDAGVEYLVRIDETLKGPRLRRARLFTERTVPPRISMWARDICSARRGILPAPRSRPKAALRD